MANPTTNPNMQDQNQNRNSQSQTQPGQKDQYSNQGAGGQKNDPGSSRVGNNMEKDEPIAQGRKDEGKDQGSYSSSTEYKNQPGKSSNG